MMTRGLLLFDFSLAAGTPRKANEIRKMPKKDAVIMLLKTAVPTPRQQLNSRGDAPCSCRSAVF